MTKDTSVIPKGQRCYEEMIWDFLGFGKLIKPCPYWVDAANNGYCAYLAKGMSSSETKECGVNTDD